MNKDVIVRKPGGQRGAVRFFGVVFIFGPLIFLFFKALVLYALCFCIPALIIIPIWVYYETWQIKFTGKEIETTVFWYKKRYTYGQIQKAIQGFMASRNGIGVRIVFVSGKTVEFLLSDENGEKGRRKLSKHCSIKSN